MNNFLVGAETFAIALTFILYFGFQKLYLRYKLFFLNPVLTTITALILFLQIFSIPYPVYSGGGKIINFLLKPAIVALGVPLYLQLEHIKRQKYAIILSQLAGCIMGIVSVVAFAKIFGASKTIILSLIPKSVTTPIAMEIANSIGGIPSITAGVVITVGLLGSVAGIWFLKLVRIQNHDAISLSMGTAAHGLGTAKMVEQSERHGAFATLGLIINGIFTAILAPWILKLIENWI